MRYNLQGSGLCAKSVDLEVSNGVVTKIEIIGGCDGWRKAAASLAVGKSVVDVVNAWKGVKCNAKCTSCADTIARILEDM